MKGRGIPKLKGKEIRLLLIVVVCFAILVWAWERTPLHTTFIPPPEIPSSVTETEAGNKQFLEVEKSGADSSTSLTEAEGKPSQNVEEENPKEKEQTLDSVESEISTNLENSMSLTETEGKHNQNVGEENPTRKEERLDWAALEGSMNSTETEEKHYQNIGEGNLKRKVALDLPEQVGSANTSVLLGEQVDKNVVVMETQDCNYAKGKWVVDDRRPLYSGFGCKQWLSPMWACRLMQRKDFAYEKLRWQPKDCQMEEFEGSKFLKRMQGKTIALVGDSLGRQQFQSLLCMITGSKKSPEVIDVGYEYGLITPQGGVRPSGWAYRFPSTNTTVLYYWSACLCDLEPIDITKQATDYAMHLDRPPAFLRQYLHKFDVLVLNTGHHWNRGKLKANRWVMYVGGVPNTNRKLAMIGDAKNFTIHSIVNWVNEQLPKYPSLKAFYRSISPRHFVNGDWNTGGSCDNTHPMSVGKEVLQDESSDYSAGNAVKGTGVKLLDITALSQLRDEGHISRFSITASPGVQDCLHWCLPGVPDTWNEILFSQVSSMTGLQTE